MVQPPAFLQAWTWCNSNLKLANCTQDELAYLPKLSLCSCLAPWLINQPPLLWLTGSHPGMHRAGVEVSMLAMAATQWEVRNAATLCYTSLMVRILGFRNTATRVSTARSSGAITQRCVRSTALLSAP